MPSRSECTALKRSASARAGGKGLQRVSDLGRYVNTPGYPDYGHTLKRHADELRRTHGVSLSTRIGINSGEVVVGRIGDDLRMDYTAQGHTVGLAQRMEACAAADSTCLTAHTARLVEGYFQLRDLGEFDLNGVSAPVRAYELQGIGSLRTRLDVSRARGFSKFVGRDREMATLEGALDAAIAGHGQVVGVVADAGTGKSQLLNSHAWG